MRTVAAKTEMAWVTLAPIREAIGLLMVTRAAIAPTTMLIIRRIFSVRAILVACLEMRSARRSQREAVSWARCCNAEESDILEQTRKTHHSETSRVRAITR